MIYVISEFWKTLDHDIFSDFAKQKQKTIRKQNGLGIFDTQSPSDVLRHPLMRRMHKPDPKLGPDLQDKRSLVLLEAEDVDAWLHAPVEQAAKLVRLIPVEVFEAAPAVD